MTISSISLFDVYLSTLPYSFCVCVCVCVCVCYLPVGTWLGFYCKCHNNSHTNSSLQGDTHLTKPVGSIAGMHMTFCAPKRGFDPWALSNKVPEGLRGQCHVPSWPILMVGLLLDLFTQLPA